MGPPVGNSLGSEDCLEKLFGRLLTVEPEDFVTDSTIREDGFEKPLVLLSFLQEKPGVLP